MAKRKPTVNPARPGKKPRQKKFAGVKPDADLERQVYDLQKVRRGWLMGDGAKPTPEALSVAARIADCLNREFSFVKEQKAAYPKSVGGISIEIRQGARFAGVEIAPDGHVELDLMEDVDLFANDCCVRLQRNVTPEAVADFVRFWFDRPIRGNVL